MMTMTNARISNTTFNNSTEIITSILVFHQYILSIVNDFCHKIHSPQNILLGTRVVSSDTSGTRFSGREVVAF